MKFFIFSILLLSLSITALCNTESNEIKSIAEVLKENEALRLENDRLRNRFDDVTKNITELQEMMAQEIVERKMNDDSLADATLAVLVDLDQEKETRQNGDTQLQNDIAKVNETIRDEVNNLHLMPIGSIVAWVMKPDKNSNHTEIVPDGWIRCDGSAIPPPSIWAGSTTPNLNGGRHFLRGGSDAECLDTELDQVQDLALSLSDPGYSHSESGHNHDDIGDQHIWADHYCAYGGADDYGSLCIAWDAAGHLENWLRTDLHSVSTAHITIDASSSGITLLQSDYRRGTETRPVNTKVIWIMRIW